MTQQVAVIGSINVDQILHIQNLPQPGETIEMTAFSKAAGGKGANQAVAAARLGAQVAFIGSVGDDANGQFMHQVLTDAQLDLTGVSVDSQAATGQAYILLQASGQNSIIIQHGANYTLNAEQVRLKACLLQNADTTVAQLEVPIPAICAGFELAHDAHRLTILNPAPAQDIPEALLQLTDIIVPNETESAKFTGIPIDQPDGLRANAAWFHQQGVPVVIIKLGEQGAYVSTRDLASQVPAFPVKAVDTTAAGDTFIGALAAQLHPNLSNVISAVRFASMASALAVQQNGAIPSIPTLTQVNQALH
jgi:ribokinase